MQVCGLKKLPNLKESMSDDFKRLGPNEKETENSGTKNKHAHFALTG
jgi:hypothetical protein